MSEREENDRPSEGVNAASELLASQDEASVSTKYRRFVITGFGRAFLTRAMSLAYILLITRLVPLDVQDKLVLLATGQWIIGVVTLFGFTYSLTRQGVYLEDRASAVASSVTASIIVGMPLTALLNFGVGLYAQLDLLEHLLYQISCSLYYLFQVALMVQHTRLRSDRAILAMAVYSVFNSLLVPSFFLLIQSSLSGILLAWIGAMSITLFLERKLLLAALKTWTINWPMAKRVFVFGLPVYLASVFAAGAQQVDSFILFLEFPTGETAQYYWVRRIATIAQELFMVFLTGALPLLTKLHKQSNTELFEKRVKSILRIGMLIGIVVYGAIYIESYMVISLILSEEFIEGVPILQVFMLAMVLRVTSLIIYQVFAARGQSRFMMEGSVTANIVRIALLFWLVSKGGIGLAWVAALHASYLLLYNFFRARRELVSALAGPRFLLASSLLVVTSLLFPRPEDLLSGALVGFAFAAAVLVILRISRPLDGDDLVMMERVFGARLQFLTRIARLFVHQHPLMTTASANNGASSIENMLERSETSKTDYEGE